MLEALSNTPKHRGVVQEALDESINSSGRGHSAVGRGYNAVGRGLLGKALAYPSSMLCEEVR